MTEPVALPAAPVEAPAPATIDAGKRANRRVGIRVLIYMVATHAFAGFIMLLFEIGSRKG
ncbi:hypothetical protein GCM10010495_56680 [Kitasatospora herbaricolor]|uniref:DUF6126 family protein n=1 Tax=Kitasatospora herbaricolor TaxID=68217 RepID=UPI00174851E3|nr:DUF6126 family protein [Kitasatospora herbaricolor]MDQ0309935.1 hypothetical protein [Kitasatospora herbaricolor]GGV32573.1 hypothetical protein GCM10010495_56680 [Kitasatospora herbaricolor]